MNPAPPRTLVDRVAWMVNHLLATIGVLYLGSPQGGRIPGPLLSLAHLRMKIFQARFTRLAARILAGTYRPRRFTPRPGTAPGKPRTETPLRRQGWLADYLPGAVAAPLRGSLIHLLESPETKALISAAPAEMARLFRPLCWALHFRPPDILANPRRPAGTPPPPIKPYVPPPPPPPIPGPGHAPGLHPMQPVPTRRISKRI